MENQEGNKKIFKYLLVVFFAVFVGTGLFLLMSNKSKISPEIISTVKVDFPEEDTTVVVVPTVPSATENAATTAAGSMTLETDLPDGQMKVGDMVEISLLADSGGKNIVGYDVVIYYDPLAFNFLRGLSKLSDYNIFTYKKGRYFTITGLKNLQSAPSPMTKANKLAALTFEATKAGKFEFELKQSNEKDKTDLITDKTEVLVPTLNQVMVDVK